MPDDETNVERNYKVNYMEDFESFYMGSTGMSIGRIRALNPKET